jgi:hypothetical protein
VNERIYTENMDEACDPEMHFFLGPSICVEKSVGKHVHRRAAATAG